MSTMAETAEAIHVGSLKDLPTERVRGLFSYGHRKWCTTTGEEENYYFRMMTLAAEELQSRVDPMAQAWQDSYAQ